MKLKLSKNWLAKLLCLLLAIGIWFLIKGHLGMLPESEGGFFSAPRATPVDEDTLEPRKR